LSRGSGWTGSGFLGSGKSTFVGLMLRNYQPQSGQILIDGMDIQQVLQHSLHEQVSLIPQDSSLFHRSLKENIGYGRLAWTMKPFKLRRVWHIPMNYSCNA